ncbi:MAG: hypothetical protein ACO1SX_18310, partial [Actinomycetota bacterium]
EPARSYTFTGNQQVIKDGDLVDFEVSIRGNGEKFARDVWRIGGSERTGDSAGAVCHSCGKGQSTLVTAADQFGPRDGRYEGGNHQLYLDLRVDEGVCGVISADVYRVDAGSRNYVASLRTAPGQKVRLAEGTWALAAQDEHGGRATGWLSLSLQDADQDTLLGTFFLESPIQGLPTRARVSFIARHVSEQLRQMGIELEMEEGVVPAEPYLLGDRRVSLESSLHDAGFETYTTGLSTRIPAVQDGWDSSTLHTLMQDLSQAPLTRRAWELHLLLLSRPRERGLLGIMFDTTDTLPRQGAAVFVDEIRSLAGIDHNRKIIQTSVHELGHALNLAHRFERSVGRADSTSFMNYDWRYRGGDRQTEFWKRFNFTFDADELEFLRHAPLPPLIPGGAAFHSVNYWAEGNGGYSPYVPERPLGGFELHLRLPDNGGLFAFGQPVYLSVELVNLTGAPQNLPHFLLDPKAGFLEVLIRRRTGEPGSSFAGARSFVPVVQRCFEWSAADVASVPHGGSIRDNLNLTFGAGGFAFAEPGTYDVTLLLGIQDQEQRRELVARSETQVLRIGTPKSDEDERAALILFREDVGLYLALGGSPGLGRAKEDLAELADRRQGKDKQVTDTVTATIRRTQAIEAHRSYVRYQDREFRVVPARPEEAAAFLMPLGNAILERSFDADTVESVHSLLAQVRDDAEPRAGAGL